MGIQGLLPAVKAAMRVGHISDYRGKRVAVDTYAWLHRGACSCAPDLCNGIENGAWIKFCLYFVDMLLDFGIEIHLVFDGNDLPAKASTESERLKNRQANLAKARSLSQSSEHDKAFPLYTQSVDINPRMAAKLIAVLRQSRPQVRIVVAPYEADAQLAYLVKEGLVDAVISEDSDNLPFGVGRVVFKWDGFQGEQVITNCQTFFARYSKLCTC